LNDENLDDSEYKELKKYGGKPYGEIKCPFFTHSKPIPDELNKETICTKCWSKYDYNCYFPKNYKCDQYNEMIKTLNPEYLKSIVNAMRTETDLELCNCNFDNRHISDEELAETMCIGDEQMVIGNMSYGNAYITVITYNKNVSCAFIIDGESNIDVGINITDTEEES